MKEFKDKKKVLIPCRFSFLRCWEPDSVNGSEPKYSVSAIIPKSDTKTVGRIKAAIEVAKQESLAKWGGKIPPNLKMPLRDGDIDRPDDEAYTGCYFLNANSREKPQIVDKDAYSVILTNDSYTFPGSINAAKAGSCTTQVLAMCGASQVAASVTLSEVTKPTGVTVTSDNDATAPTLTISVSTSVTAAGIVKIPVHVGDVTITKEFSFAIAFTGATGAQGATGATGNGVKSTAVTYASSASGTSIPSSGWDATIPSVSAGQYLWTRTVITYTDGSTSTSYSVGMMGATGAAGSTGASGKGVQATTVTYQKGTSGTTAPTGTWSSTIPTVAAGEYLWTRTVITYTDSTTSTSYSVGMMGQTGATGATGPAGAAGADAITLSITSSNGTIFKNTSIATTLTAHVYQGGTELTSAQIAALGTIKWYKDGSTTASATGVTLEIDAGDVSNKATYIAQLEG